jgi:hypothetical protein
MRLELGVGVGVGVGAGDRGSFCAVAVHDNRRSTARAEGTDIQVR